MSRCTITGLDTTAITALTHDVARALATALGDGWAYNERLTGDGERGPYATVDRGDQSIAVYGSSYEGKISIASRWEAKDALGRKIDASYSQADVRVSMSAKRDATAIVKDALRRFMPDYLAACTTYEQTVTSHRDYLGATTGAAQQLAASGAFYLEPERVRPWGQRDVSPDGERVRARCDQISNVRVYRDSVSMDLRDLTPEQAIGIAAYLAGQP